MHPLPLLLITIFLKLASAASPQDDSSDASLSSISFGSFYSPNNLAARPLKSGRYDGYPNLPQDRYSCFVTHYGWVFVARASNKSGTMRRNFPSSNPFALHFSTPNARKYYDLLLEKLQEVEAEDEVTEG